MTNFEWIAKDWAAKVILARGHLVPANGIEPAERVELFVSRTEEKLHAMAGQAAAAVLRAEHRDKAIEPRKPTDLEVKAKLVAMAEKVAEASATMAAEDSRLANRLKG